MTRILPSANEVREAYSRIGAHIIRTPLIPSPALTDAVGGEVYLKLENRQEGGSFKLRGALNALLSLNDAERAAGVVASSAGNHGIGVAIAAAKLGIRATIFVPASAPDIKREKIAALGAAVDASQPHYDAAEDAARAFAAEHGATFVSPCTGRALLAGAGTVALEIFESLPIARTVVVCVGGGGLVGGIGGFVQDAAAGVRILGAQSERTNAMSLALQRNGAVDVPDLPTLCDGLAGRVDAEMFAQGKAALDGIATATEDAVAAAIKFLHVAHGETVEGSGAVGVAALREGALKPQAFPVAVTVSGANIPPSRWRDVVSGAD
ncbi:MAG: pyridoxal-phosphate dependent enzyme [Gemmatimonadaceae bacterium]|nr:pyridoxal-phosphate dependent enzyme [Gemmatimonadaceae bacterium]